MELRAIAASDLERFVRAEERAYGWEPSDAYLRHGLASLDPARTLAVLEGGEIAATSVSHAFELSVPGGMLPAGGIAWVSVVPERRGRGLMRRLMRRHFELAREREEPLSVLWSTEGGLYGRLGYGRASFCESWMLRCDRVALEPAEPGPGQVAAADAPRARAVFPGVYDKMRSSRPGIVARSSVFWDVEFADRPDERKGGSPYLFAIHEHEASADGYLKYRRHPAERKVAVVELVSASAAAYRALWAFCLEHEPAERVEAHKRPVDDPLPWMLADPRAMQRSTHDAMWLRVMDVPAALGARSYAGEGKLVLELTDAECEWNDGRFALEAGGGPATCKATRAAPDLSLGIADLGALYLGAATFGTLHAASRIACHSKAALERADALFATPLKPWAIHRF